MPEISVRSFWKNRLMFNQSCAHKQQGFTQKHFIPAFLTQDLCILDYKYIGYSDRPNKNNVEYRTNNGEITYSLTLSYTDLYAYDIFHDIGDEVCQISFDLEPGKQFMRFFCLCTQYLCTLKITQKNPLRFCPYSLEIEIDTSLNYSNIQRTSQYMEADLFFMQDENNDFCYLSWTGKATKYNGFVGITGTPLRLGYEFDPNPKMPWFCIFTLYQKREIDSLKSWFYSNDTWELRKTFIDTIIDHSNLINDVYPIGANCTLEGPLSHPFYSSKYKSNSSMFPCYKYFEIDTLSPVYPIMGLNVIPINIVAKGKDCYYYTVKKDEKHFQVCRFLFGTPPIMTFVACPENAKYNKTEVQRIKNIVRACPSMEAGETQWKYVSTKNGICGQFLRGIKLENGKYVPEEIEFKEVTKSDFKMTGMTEKRVEHGCGFNATQTLTLCTCYSALGGCDDLFTAGRVHLLRLINFFVLQ
uniref:Uncharacterized protein n=1 Tax=Panagrolaimus superbus TaxID=310955 RepID=A0A914YTU1_9BILA